MQSSTRDKRDTPIDISPFNPFTLRVALKGIVCYSHTFENNLGIKRKLTKYFKKSCCLASDKHFSFKYFSKNVLVSLSVNGLMTLIPGDHITLFKLLDRLASTVVEADTVAVEEYWLTYAREMNSRL